jgi:hypothetical protein
MVGPTLWRASSKQVRDDTERKGIMNHMYNESNGWDHTGWHCSGKYLNLFPFSGMIESSRVKYGGKVQHTVLLDSPIEVYNSVRDVILMNHDEIEFFERKNA